jgi:hypothetical protein
MNPLERIDELEAQVAQLTALTSTCSCGTSPETYDGPQADCPVHGAIRALNEAQAELRDTRAALAEARETIVEIEMRDERASPTA